MTHYAVPLESVIELIRELTALVRKEETEPDSFDFWGEWDEAIEARDLNETSEYFKERYPELFINSEEF